MNRAFFIVALIVIVEIVLVAGGTFLYMTLGPSTRLVPKSTIFPKEEVSSTLPKRKIRPLPDIDVMAARMVHDQDTYQKLRDQALAAYDKEHPQPQPYDADARMTLRLASYLWVWGDYYGEGLWRSLTDYSRILHRKDPDNQVWQTFISFRWSQENHSRTDEKVEVVNATENRFGQTDYPVAFKLWGYELAVGNTVRAKTDSSIQPPLGESLDTLPVMVTNVISAYQQLVADHVRPSVLYDKGDDLLNLTDGDEPTLKLVSEGMDNAFETQDPDNPMAQVLDAEFYVKDAWCARGNGYANTVTDEGWRLFRERLERAHKILTDVYAKTPTEPRLANVMMTVVLGQQSPRDQMELWFQRGVQNDPNFGLYMQKRWYLLPRWYGSNEDVWNYGLECSKSTDWAHKVPLMVTEVITDRASESPEVYAEPQTWEPVEKAYLGYLEHFPNSVHIRTRFAQCAAQGGHWDVAQQQFKILSDEWDRSVLSEAHYADLLEQAKEH